MSDSRAELAQAFGFRIETRIEARGAKGVTLQFKISDFLLDIAFLHTIVAAYVFLSSAMSEIIQSFRVPQYGSV